MPRPRSEEPCDPSRLGLGYDRADPLGRGSHPCPCPLQWNNRDWAASLLLRHLKDYGCHHLDCRVDLRNLSGRCPDYRAVLHNPTAHWHQERSAPPTLRFVDRFRLSSHSPPFSFGIRFFAVAWFPSSANSGSENPGTSEPRIECLPSLNLQKVGQRRCDKSGALSCAEMTVA